MIRTAKHMAWVLLASMALTTQAQDFHMTQYDAAPVYLNPALTGMHLHPDADYRATMNYRSQWRVLTTKPYNTMMITYDQPFKNDWGVGGYLINNKTGLAKFNTLNFMLSGAYRITKGGYDLGSGTTKDQHQLTVGLQMGILYRSFNPNSLVFDSQYNTSTGDFDQSIGSGEVFGKTSLVRFDANMGMFYRYYDESKKWFPYVGLAVQRIPMPNESFTSQKQRIPVHFTFHGGSRFEVNDQLDLEPTLLLMYQARATEGNIGLMAYYRIQDSEYKPMIGVNYRYLDAVLVHAGIKYKENQFRISYDINTSYLNQFSRGRGAIEFSAIFQLGFEETKTLFSKLSFN